MLRRLPFLALAEKLRARGIENVFNLEGSLFQWANEGRPLYRGEERVYQAHPYDEEWGQLLDRRFWAVESTRAGKLRQVRE